MIVSASPSSKRNHRLIRTQCGTNAKDQEEQTQRNQIASPQIAVIFHGENNKDENGRCNDFGKYLACLGQEWLRIRAEDPCGCRVAIAGDCPNAITFVCIDRRFVVAVYDCSATKAALENM